MRTASTIWDEDLAFVRAVVATPADVAPRLIYADWLDERGDVRAEYLRSDVGLSTESRESPGWAERYKRLKQLRRGLNNVWVVAVSRGPADRVKWLDLFRRDTEGPEEQSVMVRHPTWAQVENGFRRLNQEGPYFARVRFGNDFKMCDFMEGMGGPDAVELVGRVRREHRRFVNPAARPGVWHSVGISATSERYMSLDMEVVVRALKWAYYYQDFDPGAAWTGGFRNRPTDPPSRRERLRAKAAAAISRVRSGVTATTEANP